MSQSEYRPYTTLPPGAQSAIEEAAERNGFSDAAEYLRIRILDTVAADLESNRAEVIAWGSDGGN